NEGCRRVRDMAHAKAAPTRAAVAQARAQMRATRNARPRWLPGPHLTPPRPQHVPRPIINKGGRFTIALFPDYSNRSPLMQIDNQFSSIPKDGASPTGASLEATRPTQD